MSESRSIPDQNGSLYEARDFIFGSHLGRRALETRTPKFANLIADILDATHRLSQSCNLPEFTDHGLPHLCSLVDRISKWELPIVLQDDARILTNKLQPDSAALLLVAVLIHDLGMLSQRPEDLPDSHPISLDPSQWSDVASWVRRTHVIRLPKLVRRIMGTYSHDYTRLFDQCDFECLGPAIEIAMAHQAWPWQWSGVWAERKIHRGLAAVVSVADLLDEDSARCDTETLLQHRGGDELNRAHWIRHALTAKRVVVSNGEIAIKFCKPVRTGRVFKPVFSALRNHFRLVLLYEDELRHVNAPITNVHLEPSTGLPQSDAVGLSSWNEFDGFENESSFAFQILRTFMPEALKDTRKLSSLTLEHLRSASLEDVDLAILENAEISVEPRTMEEQTFNAIVGNVL